LHIEFSLNPKLKVDGHFYGWVEESKRSALGIAEDAASAWSSAGGGTFSRNMKVEDCPDVAKARILRQRGWSVAKAVSKTLLWKNPNAYFYRHAAPGDSRKFGDFSEEETKRFVAIAREYGCGDKWGLFASYLPGRVGYDCSVSRL